MGKWNKPKNQLIEWNFRDLGGKNIGKKGQQTRRLIRTNSYNFYRNSLKMACLLILALARITKKGGVCCWKKNAKLIINEWFSNKNHPAKLV